ncbi:autotransporter-associated beta strand repeat-containing protein [Methyloraptor flagellatus]|uniref:Autotransporter-associated beta strand repeat-containing protein n=1 Tax=Methyloraptor flagellatus TaxID=3162530 RepID=A0AAU7XGB9_9HYPH
MRGRKTRLAAGVSVLSLILAAGATQVRADSVVVTDQSGFESAVSSAINSGQPTSITAQGGSTFVVPPGWDLPGNASSLLLTFNTSPLDIGTANGDSDLTLRSGTTLTLNTTSGSSAGRIELGNGNGSTGTLNISGGTVQVNLANTSTAPATSIGRIWVGGGATNTDGGTGTLNMTAGELHYVANAGSLNYGGLAIGRGTAVTGTFDQSGGTVRFSSAGMLDLGTVGATGSYTLSGDAVFDATSGGMTAYIGSRTSGAGGSGTASNGTLTISDNAQFSITTGSFAGGQLYVGDSKGTGVINQNGAGSVVTLGLANPIRFGSDVSNYGTGGSGTYNLSAGTLSVQNVGGSAQIVFGASSGGTGTFNISGGSANVATQLVLASVAGSTGTVNLTGGSLTLSGSSYLNFGSGTGTFNLSGGSFTVGGTNGIRGTGAFNFDGGTLVAGAGLTTSNAMTINAGKTATINTNGNTATLSGVLSGSGALTKTGTGSLILSGTNTYSGGTTISAGTLQLGAGGTTGMVPGDITDNGDLAFNRSDDLTYSAIVSGTGSLTQAGSGILTLSGANTFGGGVIVSAGTLSVGSDGVMGASTGAVTLAGGGILSPSAAFSSGRAVHFGTGGGTIDIASGNDLTLTGTLDGSGGLTKSGAGTLILSGAASYTGATTISAGSVQINGTSFSSDIANSGTLFFGSDLTYAGTLSGTGTVTKNGTGTLILSGTNTYSGGTTISAGTVQIAADAALGSGSLTLSGGTLTSTATFSSSRDATLSSGSTISVATGTVLTLTGVLGGTGGLTASGAGTLVLSGTNTYTGGTTISAGTLQIASNTALGSGALSLGGGTLSTTGTFTFNRNVTLTSSSAVSVATGTTLTLSGVVSGGGGLTTNGAGTLVLSGANTYTGGTTIAGGTVQIAANSGLGNSGGAVTLSDGTLAVTATFSSSRVTTLSGSGGTIVPASGTSLIWSGKISGSGALTKSGAGTLVLGGANDYTGGTTINSGTVSINADNRLGDTSGALTMAGGTLATSASLTISRAVSLSADATFSAAATTIISGAITGSGRLTKSGTATLSLTGANTYSGGTTISQGTLQIGNQGTTGSITGDITNNATLAFARSDDITFDGVISGTGTVTKRGVGTLTLTGTNTYSGITSVSAGTLQVSADANLGGSGNVAFNGGTLATTETFSSSRNVTLNVMGLLAPATGTALTLSGVVSGSGGLTQTGAGTLVLAGTNTYTGGTTVSAGTLEVSADTNLGGSGTLTLSGGTFATTADLTSARSVVLSNSSTIAPAVGTTLTLSNVVSGSGGLIKAGAGTLVLEASNNTYSGGTTVAAGTLEIGNDGNLGNGSAGLTLSGGTLSTIGAFTSNRAVAITADSTVSTDAGTTLTLGGIVSGTGALTKSGAGTLVLTGTNTYSGGTVLAGGILQMSDDAQLGAASGGLTLDGGTLAIVTDISSARSVSVASNSAINIDPGVTLTLTGTISDGGSYSKTGDGTLVLAGTDAHIGGTVVTAGTLQVGDGATSGSLVGSVSLDSGASLVFNRTDATTFGGEISGNGSVTQAGTGTLTLAGENSYSGGTFVTAGTLQVGNGGTTGHISGDVVNNAALVFDRSDAVTFAGVISGTGTVTQAGTGTLTLSGTSTYTGGTTVSAGTLQISANANLGDASGGLTLAGGTLATSADVTTGRTITLTGGGTVAPASSKSLTLAGVVSGTGGLTMAGAGRLTLSGTNTYGGGTTVSAGTLVISSDGNLGDAAGGLALSGAILNTGNSTISSARAVSLSGSSSIATTGAGTLTLSGVVSGTGSLSKGSAGTLVLSGTNTYSGGTTIRAGTVQVSSDANLGGATGGLVMGGGTLATTASFTSNRGVDFTNIGTFQTATGTTLTLTGGITGLGVINKTGAGTLVLAGTNTDNDGGATISAGTLQVGNGGTSGVLLGDVSNNASLVFDRSDAVTFLYAIDGSGSLTQAGTGTLTLSGSSSYTGGTTVSSGSLVVSGSIAGAVSVASGATLGGGGSIAGIVTLSSGATLAPGVAGTPGTLSVGGLSVASGATLAFNLAQPNGPTSNLNDRIAVTGNVTLSGGLLTVNDGASFQAGSYRLIDYSGTLTLTGAGLSVSGTPASLTSSVIQTAVAGQVNLVALVDGVSTQWWNGAGTAGSGTISGGAGTWSAAATNWTNVNGTIAQAWIDGGLGIFNGIAGNVAVSGTVNASGLQFAITGYTLGGTGTLTLVSQAGGGAPYVQVDSGTATITTVIAGTVGLTKTGTGTLVLGGTNTYTGGTTLSAGTLQVASDANLGDTSGSLTLAGGTLATTVSFTSGRAVALTGAGAVAPATATTLTLGGVISGTGALTKSGAGTLVLSGSNTYTGGTTVSAGTLQVASDGNLGDASGGLTLAGGTLATTASFTSNRAVTLAGGALAPAAATTLTIGTAISGSGGLTHAGAGTLVLGGANTYTGTTTVTAGTLRATNAGAIPGAVANGGTVIFDTSADITMGGAITGTGALVQQGTGKLTLAGANSASGGTTVSAGTLELPNGVTLTGDVLVQSGGTLQGATDSTGGPSVAGTVTIQNGATLKATVPAAGGLGSLSMTGLALSNLSNVAVTLGASTGTTAVSVGDLTLDGVLNVTDAGALSLGVYRLVSYSTLVADNGLVLGTTPSGFAYQIQQAPGAVNLAVLSGDMLYWNGTTTSADGTVHGGSGTWTASGSSPNWLTSPLNQSRAWNSQFAVFTGTAGSVAVSGSVTSTGMQFMVDGYGVTGDAITLAATAGRPPVRVGDGTGAGAAFVATIASPLAGTTGLEKTDLGTLVLTGASTYSGGTVVTQGRLQIGDGGTAGSIAGDVAVASGATLAFKRSDTVAFAGAVSGAGGIAQLGTGTLTLTGANTFTGGATIAAGTLQIGGGGTQGALAGDVVDNGRLVFDRSDDIAFGGAISGTGSLTKDGAGTLTLSGAGTYTGGTDVTRGTLALTGSLAGDVTVRDQATLTGSGATTGTVHVLSGATLAGAQGAALTMGGLALDAGSHLAVTLGGTSGGGVFTANGGVTLDGTLDVVASTGFGAGVYRIVSYTGALTDNGLDPSALGGSLSGRVQTSVGGQVNLVVARTDAPILAWNGSQTVANGSVVGGSGTWSASAATNWTNPAGDTALSWNGGFAVFQATGGTVTVDNGAGQVSVTGLQFADTGYVVTGGAIALAGTGTATIRVGDGTTAGASKVATIQSALIGAAGIEKTDLGTLILAGSNTYTGGTTVSAGTLRVGDGATAGSILGDVVNNAALVFDRSDATRFDGAISGTGSVTKAGAGTLTLAGANSYSGGTTVAGGTLRLLAAQALGSGGLTLGGGGTLQAGDSFAYAGAVLLGGPGAAGIAVDADKTLTLSGVLSGTGGFTKTGTGTLVLSGTNSYTGGTTVGAGTLVGNASSLSGNITNNAAVVFDQTGTGTYGSVISGTGSLTKTGSGTLILTGDNTYTGGTTVSAGVLQVGNGGTTGAIVGDVVNNATLIFNRSDAYTFTGAITGSGKVIFSGGGLVQFAAPYTGAVTTENSFLRLAPGTTTSSTITVNAGGVLGGTAQIGGLTVNAGGTAAPGYSPGTLTVAGAVTFNAGAVYAVDVTPEGAHDLIIATGDVSISSGASVRVTPVAGTYPNRSTMTILTTSGTVTGRFGSVTSDYAFLQPELGYDLRNVYLNLVYTGAAFADQAQTPNQARVAVAAQALGAGNAVYDALLTQAKGAVAPALDQLGGDIYPSLSTLSQQSSIRLRDAVGARLRQTAPGAGALATAARLGGPGTAAFGHDLTATVWAQGHGGWGDFYGDGNAAGLSSSAGGLLAGVDAMVFDDIQAGIVAGFTQTRFTASARNASGAIDSYDLGLYVGTQQGPFALRGGVSYTWQDLRVTRAVAFPGFTAAQKAGYGLGTTQIFGEASYRMAFAGFEFEPFAGLAHVSVSGGSAIETGGSADLSVRVRGQQTLYSTLGARAATTFTVGGHTLTPSLSVGWQHAFGDTASTADMAFAAGATPFQVRGLPIARDTLVVGAGLSYALSDQATIQVNYAGQLAAGARQNAISARFSLKF